MRKDARAIRAEATDAVAGGKWKRALACYIELERLEPDDPQWPKRAAEMYRRLGKDRDAVAAYDRAADRYARIGFVVQSIAVCKVILQLEPDHPATRNRLAAMTAAQATEPRWTPSTGPQEPQRSAVRFDLPRPAPTNGEVEAGVEGETTSPVAVPRTRTPIRLAPGAPLEQVSLGSVVPGARARPRDDGSSSGIVVIPLDDELDPAVVEESPALTIEDHSVDVDTLADVPELPEPELDVPTEELSLDDLVDVAELPSPRALSAAARRAVADTPLFNGLGGAALEALIEHCALVSLAPGDVLFRAGDPGRVLYVVAEGEVAVIAEGPPRLEVARLGAGAFFGEIALVTEQPRSATIEARAATELLAIDRDVVGELLTEHPDVLRVVLRFVRGRLIELLMRTSPMFAPLPERERASLAARFDFLEIEPGAFLLEEGSRGDGLYVLLAGRADVFRGERRVTRLGPGDLVGITTLLDATPAPGGVRAATKCLALHLAGPAFREVIMTHPHVLEYVGQQADLRRQQVELGAQIDDSGEMRLDIL